MNKIISILLLLSCVGNVVAQNIQPKRTVIAGQVRNFQPTDNQVISVNYTDPVNNNRAAVRIAKDGKFHTTGDMCVTQNITVSFCNRFINILVSPADSVFIDIDMNLYRTSETYDGITFSGKNNIEFNQQLPAFYTYLIGLMPNFKEGLPANEFIVEFRKAVDSAYVKIDEYAKKNNILPQLVEWGKRDVVYTYANYIVSYYNGDTETQARFIINTNEIFDINNPDNFKTMMFPYHLQVVSSSIFASNPKIISYLKENDVENSLKEGCKTYMQLMPASLCRDYVIYIFVRLVLTYAEQLGPIPDKLSDCIPADCFMDTYFVDQIKSIIKPATQNNAGVLIQGVSYLGTDKKASQLPEIDFVEYIAKKYPNKVIYLDVYATWCGPCMAEMEPSKELRKLFDGKEDVVFVYACLSSDVNKWGSTIEKHEIVGENYFFDEDASKMFMANYQLAGYPSYMLINKQGKVVTTDAPRPSDITKTAGDIDKLRNN